MQKKNLIIASLLLLLMLPAAVLAQSVISAEIIQIDASEFPRVTGYLDVRGENGMFFPDLKHPNLSIMEEGEKLLVDELVAAKPGVQFILAISPTNAFKIRDAQGVTRYDYLLGAITTWAQLLAPTGNDAITLATTQGNLLDGVEDPDTLIQMLQTFQPDFELAEPNLDVLSRAVDLAADDPPRIGMGRVVLFVTSSPAGETVEVIRGITDRAMAQDVRVLIWLVDSSANFDSPGAAALRELADLTGGVYYPFSGVEPLPEIEAYLEPLRYVYKFGYQSNITRAGTFPIAVEVQFEDIVIQTVPEEIEVLVQAPNPIILDPPRQIDRTYSTNVENQPENLRPLSEEIEILIEFDDDVERSIVRSSMFVDGELVSENLSAPFNVFNWDLSAIIQSDDYTISFEVEDEFGLIGTSAQTDILVEVEVPPNNLRVFITRYGTGLMVLAGALIAGFFVVTLFLSGKLRPRPITEQISRRRKKYDPVTQPLGAQRKPKPFRFPKLPESRISRMEKQKEEQIGELIAVVEGEETPLISRLIISSSSTVIGSDPARADLILEDIAIDPAHARIEKAETDFLIFDLGSTAGTYVNYKPVGEDGYPLLHKDIVHFGCFGFCFEAKKPYTIRNIEIIEIKDER